MIIKTKNIREKLTEYALHKLILEDMDNFLKELGIGFLYAGHEVKIKIGPTYHRIDFLLFNYNYNSFIVLEVKINEFKREHTAQIKEYMNYTDKHIKKVFHDKTIGIILCKKENKLVLEYVSDERIFTTTYKILR